MLTDAFVLAFLTTAGFYMIYKKLPKKVRKFLEKHALITDLCGAVLTYVLLGGTLTALTAAALVGIFTSCLLHIANNPDDFTYIFDFIEAIKNTLNTLKQALKQYGQEYREKKEATVQC